jgi:hypothetical protein
LSDDHRTVFLLKEADGYDHAEWWRKCIAVERGRRREES